MYYLLRQRLNRPLSEQYKIFHRQLLDSYEDVIEDFFLYLREGKNGQNRTPYQSLQRIKNKDSFETWLLNTFRNYLSGRARAEDKISFTTYDSGESWGQVSDWVNDHNHATCPHDSLTDEQKLAIASQLIAYAHQVFYPRGRFIFLRSLLTILNKQKALPDRDMATALGMTYLSYRVMAHRMRRNLSKFRQRILCGEQLQLDEQHQQMAQQIYNDFIHLYPTLMTYYTQSIATLKCADAISQLRQDYYESTGYIVHEPEPPTANTITIVGFWERLNRMLIY